MLKQNEPKAKPEVDGGDGWDVDFQDKTGETPWEDLDGNGKVKRLLIIFSKITLIVGALYLFIWCAAHARALYSIAWPRRDAPSPAQSLLVCAARGALTSHPASHVTAAFLSLPMASVSLLVGKRAKSSATPRSLTIRSQP